MRSNTTLGEFDFLCPECSNEIETAHIVQCSCCQTIIDYLPVEEGESPIVLFVDECEHCVRLKKSEWGFDSFFTESYL